MAANEAVSSVRRETLGRKFSSFRDWKQTYFPKLVQDEQDETLRRNPDELARVLADKAFEHLRKRKGS
jgi:hypothetical protein